MFKSGKKLHWIKNLYQRYRYGAGCCDRFNLDYYLAKKILPTLKRFKVGLGSYPQDENIKTFEDWIVIIDKMIWSFEYLLDGEDYPDGDIEKMKELAQKEQEGFELFGKYFRSLWM